MSLDLPTIMVLCIVVGSSLTLYLMVVWVNHRREFKGIGHSVLGLLCMTLNFIGLLLQGRAHPLVSVVLANAFVPVGYALLIYALYRILDKKIRTASLVVFLLIILAVVVEQTIFGVYMPLLKIRMVFMGLVILGFSLAISLFLIVNGQFRNPPGKLLIFSFLIQFVVFALRIPYTLLSENLPVYFLHTGGFQSLAALSWIIASCAWPTGFTLLISHKLQKREERQNEEKTVLLQELHHRTKNNMQSIIAYMQLQQYFTPSPEAREQLQMAENRIHAINLVHKKLYTSQDLSHISLKSYIDELTGLIFDSYRISRDDIAYEADIEDFEVLIDMAIPVGLIINELFSNTFKHAFPDGKGTLSLTINRSGDTIVMVVRDNGKGLPDGFDPGGDKTLGIQTVCGIVKGQLRGSIEFRSEGGFFCRMVLDNSLYGKRI